MFKVGDSVVAIQTTGRLVADTIYTIKRIEGEYVHIDGFEGGYFATRFRKNHKVNSKFTITNNKRRRNASSTQGN